MKESKERQERFEKFQKRKWETFRLELEKNEVDTNEKKTPKKEIAKDAMIQLPKKAHKRKTTSKPTTPNEVDKPTEEIILEPITTLNGQIYHRCYICSKNMQNANSLKSHLQGKEHKRISKQVKEIQAQATNTKRRKAKCA